MNENDTECPEPYPVSVRCPLVTETDVALGYIPSVPGVCLDKGLACYK